MSLDTLHKPISKRKRRVEFYLQQAKIQILLGELYFSLYLTDIKEYIITLSLKSFDTNYVMVPEGR